MKILLVSHGAIAEGFRSTLVDFFGAENFYAASVNLETGTEDLLNKVNDYLDKWPDKEQVLICSDIMGGSANQAVFPLIDRPNILLLAGMNLPLLIQLHLQMDQRELTAETLQGIVEAARSEITLVNRQDFFTRDKDDE